MFEISNYKDVCIAMNLNTNMGANIKVFLYVVDGLLIDCGPQSMEEDVASFIRTQKIEHVALTHLHEDHVGMASWVEKNLKVPIYLNASSIAEAKNDAEYAEYRRLTWGERKAFNPQPLGNTICTPKYSFEVISTPGHLPQHDILFEKNQGWLFSGDLFVRPKLRFCSYDEDMKQIIASLEKVLELDFETMFCAHKGMMENGREMLQMKLSFLLELQAKVNSLRREGLTDLEIDAQLFPGDQIISEVSGGEWTSYNIVKTI